MEEAVLRNVAAAVVADSSIDWEEGEVDKIAASRNCRKSNFEVVDKRTEHLPQEQVVHRSAREAAEERMTKGSAAQSKKEN